MQRGQRGHREAPRCLSQLLQNLSHGKDQHLRIQDASLAVLFPPESHYTACLPIGNVPETLGHMGPALPQVTVALRKVALDLKEGEPCRGHGWTLS